MNDTEERLRDYLETKAGTVPGNAQGPGLLAESTHRRSVWPIIAAAAAVGAVLAFTATVLTIDKPAPAVTPATDAPPALPYIVTEVSNSQPRPIGGGTSTLYDGAQKVLVPDGVTVDARVDGGWLGDVFTDKGTHVVILRPDGTTRNLGPELSHSPVLSPDGRQVAMIVDKFRGDEQGRVAIIDLASGSEVGSTPLPRKVSVVPGWGSRGIFAYSDISGKHEYFAARPGDEQFQLVSLPGFGGGTIATNPGTDLVAVGAGGAGCLEAGVFRGDKFDVLRKYCEPGKSGAQPMLSTDGRTMIYADSNLAVDIASGKTTKLDLPDPMVGYPPGAFEDATHALVITQARKVRDFGPQRLYRCDVSIGKCTLLRTENAPSDMMIVRD